VRLLFGLPQVEIGDELDDPEWKDRIRHVHSLEAHKTDGGWSSKGLDLTTLSGYSTGGMPTEND
jgi:hypothetical protein